METQHADIIQKILEKIAEEKKYNKDGIECKAVATAGGNYTSALFKAKLQDPQKEDINLFAKVSTVGDENLMNQMFDSEIFFYTELVEAFNNLYEKFAVPNEKRMIFPDFYTYETKPNEAIVLENLEAKGYKVANRMESVTWEFAEKSIEELAKYHALSLALKEHIPNDYERLIESRGYQFETQREGADTFFETLCRRIIEVIEDKYKERFAKYIQKLTPETWSEVNMPMPGAPSVLVHADYRQSNLMFKRKGDELVIVPLDYQTIHSGRATTDLIYFIMTSTDQQFRRLHYQRLIDLYYAKLTEALQAFEVDISKAFPKELYLEELQDSMVHAVMTIIFVLPFVTFDSDAAPTIQTFLDPDSKYNFGSLYPERLNGIVADLVSWGVL